MILSQYRLRAVMAHEARVRRRLAGFQPGDVAKDLSEWQCTTARLAQKLNQ